MEEKKNFELAVQSMLNGLNQFVSSKTVVGDVIRVDEDTLILPLVNISLGVGAGAKTNDTKASSFGGGGLGAKMNPCAVLLIQNGSARIINIQEQDRVVNLLENAPDIVSRLVGMVRKNPKVDKAIDKAFDNMKV